MARVVSKSIAIIGEGETEWFYFDSLRVVCRFPFKVAPDFPQHSDIRHVLKLVESYIAKQYDYIVCLFDMDRLYQYPSEMQQYQSAKKKYSSKKYAGRVMFIETNPCTEFWFLLHFLPIWCANTMKLTSSYFRNYRSICQDMKRQSVISFVPISTSILLRMVTWNVLSKIQRSCANYVRRLQKT